MKLKPPISVIVCRVGRLPVVEPIVTNDRGGYVFQISLLIDGFGQRVRLDDDLELWCDEDAELKGKELNRLVPAPSDMPDEGDFDWIIQIRRDGDPPYAPAGTIGVHKILGDFVIVRTAKVFDEIEMVDVNDDDYRKYLTMFEAEDIEVARRMNQEQVDASFRKPLGERLAIIETQEKAREKRKADLEDHNRDGWDNDSTGGESG